MVPQSMMRDSKGRFIKGHKVREEWKEKWTKKQKGRHHSKETEFKRGHTPWNIGLNSVEIVCENCGKAFKRSSWRTKENERNYKHQFCSLGCKYERARGSNHPNWRGGHEPYYGPNWEEVKKKTLERDNNCKMCGSTDKLKVHHVIPFKKFGRKRYFDANRLNNLITLCASCHNKVTFGTLEVDSHDVSKT